MEKANKRYKEEEELKVKNRKNIDKYNKKMGTRGKACSKCGENSVWPKSADDEYHDETYEWEECFNCRSSF